MMIAFCGTLFSGLDYQKGMAQLFAFIAYPTCKIRCSTLTKLAKILYEIIVFIYTCIRYNFQRNAISISSLFLFFSPYSCGSGSRPRLYLNRLKRQLADKGFILYRDAHSQFAESNLSFPRCSPPEMFIEIPNFFLKNVEKTNKSLSTM